MKIAFIGACGSGKSTMASKVYTALKERRLNVELVDENIRREIHKHGAMKSIWEQYRTRQLQKDIEDAIPAEVEFTIVDSGTLTPYFYATLYADHTDSRQRLVMQDMYRYLLDDLYLHRYDYIFYLTPIPDVNLQDGTRYQSDAERDLLAEHMEMVFTKLYRTGNTHLIDGPADGRFAAVEQVLIQHGVIAAVSAVELPPFAAMEDDASPIDWWAATHPIWATRGRELAQDRSGPKITRDSVERVRRIVAKAEANQIVVEAGIGDDLPIMDAVPDEPDNRLTLAKLKQIIDQARQDREKALGAAESEAQSQSHDRIKNILLEIKNRRKTDETNTDDEVQPDDAEYDPDITSESHQDPSEDYKPGRPSRY